MRTAHLALNVLLAGAALAACWPAAATGTAEVRWVEPDRYTDAGTGPLDRARTLEALAEHFGRLARRLPDGQTLRVEVLDVDLAGDVRPRHGLEVRVLRGGADWPRLELRYALTAPASDGGSVRTLQQGAERLADMTYLSLARSRPVDGSLPFEKRMLDRWFESRFGNHMAAAAAGAASPPPPGGR